MNEAVCPLFSVLLVDDEAPWLRSLSMTLEGPGAINNIILCGDSRQVMAILDEREVGLVLLDLTMPHLSGEELLRMIAQEHPEIAVIVMSGMNQIETAVSCMKLGAFDYLVKTVEEDRILDSVRRAIRMQELQRENREMRSRFLNDRLEHPEAFADIVTNNKTMRSAFQYIEAVAKSTQPILITGESGVGKELVARAVHTLSRGRGPLVSVNVAGLDDNVFADTLFGHTKGAFTGANEARSGMVEQAAEGTLFLDEIGDLSLLSQVKLLRLLQEGEYYPLGSDMPRQLKARIVVATHQDLAEKRAAGQFRKDLFYRLRAHHVHLPPLRERGDDLPLLLDHFLEEELPAHVVVLPDGEDPDSFMRKFGVGAFEERVESSVPVFEYFMREQCRQSDSGSVEGKVKILGELVPRLEKMANPLERDLYIREVSRFIGVEEDILLKRVKRKGEPLPQSAPSFRKEKGKSGIGAEEMLLSLMGKFPDVAEKVREFGISLLFREDLIPVAENIIFQVSTNSEIDWPKTLELVNSPEERSRLASLFVDDRHLEEIDAEKAFDQCRLALERAALREMKALARELAAAEAGSDHYFELLGKIDSLRNRKSRLS